MAEIKEPDAKFLSIKRKLQVYSPKIEQVLVYPTNGKGDIEKLSVWLQVAAPGFNESFDVSSREENRSGITTGKLD